jgi:N-acetyl-gamma-glutamylphosphate reductase
MVKVAIVGGSGYTGVELLRLLAAHPEVEITAVTSRRKPPAGGGRVPFPVRAVRRPGWLGL